MNWLGIGLQKGAESGDGFADDQVLHLEGAFIRVERFTIVEEAGDLVVGYDAVAAEYFPSPRNCLATLGRAECFRQGRMCVAQLSFSKQLGLAHEQAL